MKTILKITAGILLACTVLIGGCTALVGAGASSVSKQMDKQEQATKASDAERKANMAQVKVGMTMSEVKSLVGQPSDTDESESESFDGGTTKMVTWSYSNEWLQGDFWNLIFIDGKLDHKARI